MRRTWCTSLASAGALALAGCGTGAKLEEARRKKAEVQVETLRMSAELAYLKTGAYPATLAEVEVATHEDPWGRPFSYAVVGSDLRISSNGPDGIAGNADDVHGVER